MRILISYYSRSGNNAKIAHILKECLDGFPEVETQVEVIEDLKDRSGTSGYILGGRDAMLKKPADIKIPTFDVSDFDMLVIGGPVWAWTVSPAIRTYCMKYGRDAARLAFFCTMGSSGNKGAFAEMEKLCTKAPVAVLAFKDRQLGENGVLLKDGITDFAAECVSV